VNTLSYTAQMVESSRADKEKAAFNEVRMRMRMHMHCTCTLHALFSLLWPVTHQVEKWTGARVVAWATALEDGKYAHLAHCFARRCVPPPPSPTLTPALPQNPLCTPNPSLRSFPPPPTLPLPARASSYLASGSSMCASGSLPQEGRRRRDRSSTRPSRRCTRRRRRRRRARGPSRSSLALSSRALSAQTSWQTDLKRRWRTEWSWQRRL